MGRQDAGVGKRRRPMTDDFLPALPALPILPVLSSYVVSRPFTTSRPMVFRSVPNQITPRRAS